MEGFQTLPATSQGPALGTDTNDMVIDENSHQDDVAVFSSEIGQESREISSPQDSDEDITSENPRATTTQDPNSMMTEDSFIYQSPVPPSSELDGSLANVFHFGHSQSSRSQEQEFREFKKRKSYKTHPRASLSSQDEGGSSSSQPPQIRSSHSPTPGSINRPHQRPTRADEEPTAVPPSTTFIPPIAQVRLVQPTVMTIADIDPGWSNEQILSILEEIQDRLELTIAKEYIQNLESGQLPRQIRINQVRSILLVEISTPNPVLPYASVKTSIVSTTGTSYTRSFLISFMEGIKTTNTNDWDCTLECRGLGGSLEDITLQAQVLQQFIAAKGS